MFSSFKGESLSKIYPASCNTPICKEGLDACIASDCYVARDCKSIIDGNYPTCSRCVVDILDPSTHATVNGNNYLVCDSEDDLQVKVCLFYCRVYYYPYGECVKQYSVPICKCLDEAPITTTTSTVAPVSSLSIGTLLQTLSGHTNQVRALTKLPDGDIASGSVDATINIWDSVDGTLIDTIAAHATVLVCNLHLDVK